MGLGAVAFSATLILLFGFVEPRQPVGWERRAPRPGRPARGRRRARPEPGDRDLVRGPGRARRSGDPVLVGAGDIADCALDSGAATAALLDTIEGTVFTAGDNAYPNGSAAQFRDCYAPTWGRHWTGRSPPPGNHDWETKDLAGYLEYFGAAAGAGRHELVLVRPRRVARDRPRLGLRRSSAVVPEFDRRVAGSQADLEASTAGCTMAIWHHPRFSSGEHGNDTSVWPFWDALYGPGADVVVNGHDHDYERFGPQDPAGREDKARGLREFVVGTGGAVLRDFPTVAAAQRGPHRRDVRGHPVRAPPDLVRVVVHRGVGRGRGLRDRHLSLRYRGRP